MVLDNRLDRLRRKVDIFCGPFLESSNRGFGISPEVSKLLSDRYLDIGFDLYFDPPKCVGALPAIRRFLTVY
jgi:hypothetical protein